jgi:hypothetical protein
VDALVAHAERLGHLPHRGARGVQDADQVVVVDLRRLGVVLQAEQLVAGGPRLLEEFLVQDHAVYSDRQRGLRQAV